MVKFMLVSSWDPDLIITVLFTLIIIYWFEQEVAALAHGLYCGNARC